VKFEIPTGKTNPGTPTKTHVSRKARKDPKAKPQNQVLPPGFLSLLGEANLPIIHAKIAFILIIPYGLAKKIHFRFQINKMQNSAFDSCKGHAMFGAEGPQGNPLGPLSHFQRLAPTARAFSVFGLPNTAGSTVAGPDLRTKGMNDGYGTAKSGDRAQRQTLCPTSHSKW
jgi:hypothetical protein